MSRNPVSLSIEPSVLSPREREVLIALARGGTNREFAEACTPRISVKTVDTHRGKVLKKLRLRNNSDIARYAIHHGLIDAHGIVLQATDPVTTVVPHARNDANIGGEFHTGHRSGDGGGRSSEL